MKLPRRGFVRGPSSLSLVVILAAGLLPSGLAAQDFDALVSTCSAGAGGLTGRCHIAAHALFAARGALGTALSLGSQVPGSASTLGYRLRTRPRMAISGRLGLTHFSMPEIREGYGLPMGDESPLVPSLHLSGVMGLLNGFSLSPTVAGVLAVDLTASGQLLFPQKSDGFQKRVAGWGIGARVGLLRESFTLPGISLSVSRRWGENAQVGDMRGGDAAQIRFDPDMTSFRGIVGKDILGMGLFAGAGLDRMSGSGSIGIRVSPTGFETEAFAKELRADKAVFFAGGSMTFLIIQLSGELGWSQALDAPLPIEPGGTDFPSARAYFGSLALRVTF